MVKLNLVIADIDESYVKGLSAYVNSYHSTAFSLSCFTKADFLMVHMQQHGVDVLLISKEFYEIAASYTGIKLKVLLSEDAAIPASPGFQVVNRFCTGEKLLGEIIHLYSMINPSESRFSAALKQSRVIGVYSPAGGTGKTTIAAALSIQCRELDLCSFYLNLESVQSTGIFFNTNSKRNLSYVFYYLKEKGSNLSLRMEGIKSSDAEAGVEYFCPPESPLEYGEIDAAELEQLICGIKGMGCYDYIFVDMSCAFDMKNYKLMGLCDYVILVVLQEPASLLKHKVLINELDKLEEGGMGDISDRLVTVINKYKDMDKEGLEDLLADISDTVRIPEYTRALIREDGLVTIDDDGFRRAVNQLLNIITVK